MAAGGHARSRESPLLRLFPFYYRSNIFILSPRQVLGAKNAKIGAERRKNLPFRAKNPSKSAGKGNNKSIGAKIPENGAALPNLSTTLREKPQSSMKFFRVRNNQ